MRTTLLALMILVTFIPAALPCDCVPPRSVTDELAAADAVFVGTLIGEMLEDPRPDVPDDWGRQVLLFEVEAGFKKVRTETVELMNRRNSTCAHEFVKDATYLIYAFKTTAGELHTHICSRTAHVDDSIDDLEELGEPEYLKEELR